MNDEVSNEVIKGIFAILVALLTAVLGYVIGHFQSRWSLRLEYDKDLRKRRIACYAKLWMELKPLARYPAPGPLAYDALRVLSLSMRDWYFNEGGLFLSVESRNRYFDLQDGCRILLEKRAKRWTLDEGAKEFHDHLWDYLRREPAEQVMILAKARLHGDEDQLSNDHFMCLLHLGSQLRASMSGDALTREKGYLRSAQGSGLPRLKGGRKVPDPA